VTWASWSIRTWSCALTCQAASQQLRSIRHLVSATVFQLQSIVAALLYWLDYYNGTLVGLPAYLICRLQSVQNAASRLTFRLCRLDHSAVLVSQSPLVTSAGKDRVQGQTYRALHGDAPQYLRQFTPIADVPFRQRFRSSTSDNLLVPAVKLSTVGRCAFIVAGASIWMERFTIRYYQSSPSLLTFKHQQKCTYVIFPIPV